MGQTIGSYAAELLKYGGVSVVALALGGILLGALQLALAGDGVWSSLVIGVALPPILGMAAAGGLCWAIGHILLHPRKA